MYIYYFCPNSFIQSDNLLMNKESSMNLKSKKKNNHKIIFNLHQFFLYHNNKNKDIIHFHSYKFSLKFCSHDEIKFFKKKNLELHCKKLNEIIKHLLNLFFGAIFKRKYFFFP